MFVFYGIPLVIVLLGGWLFILGVRPRRRGETPYCRKCGYNLTGRTLGDAGERCSECGAGLIAANIVHGERRRRPWRAGLGVFVALLGATPLVLQATGALVAIDWYKFKPTGWVKADAEAANLGLAKRAFTELDRRYVADALSGDDRRWFIEFCLKEHALRPGRTGIQTGAVNVLWREQQLARLMPEQSRRLFDNMVTLKLDTRPRVAAGDPFYVVVYQEVAVPVGVQVKVRWAGVGIGDVWVPNEGLMAWERVVAAPNCPDTWRCRALYSAPDDLGEYELRARVDVSLNFNPLAARGAAPSGRRELTARLAVVPSDDAAATALPRDYAQDVLLRHIMQVSACALPRDNGVVFKTWSVATISFGLAFEIIVDTPDGETVVGTYARPKGGPPWHSRDALLIWKGPVPDTITVRLRGSETVARQTADVLDYWPGELVFENVPVESQSAQFLATFEGYPTKQGSTASTSRPATILPRVVPR